MLEFEPSKRSKIDQIRASDWYSGSVPMDEEIIDELSERREALNEARE